MIFNLDCRECQLRRGGRELSAVVAFSLFRRFAAVEKKEKLCFPAPAAFSAFAAEGSRTVMCHRRRVAVTLLTVLAFAPVFGRVAAAEPCPCAWNGIYPTVVTPFCGPCGGVDVASLECQIKRELHCGVHGLLVLGTFGEGQFTTTDERTQVIGTAVRVAGRVPVVAGIHTCDLEIARAQVSQARELGAAAVLVKYLGNRKASFAEVCGFYTALGDAGLPIIYYHYPNQTGLNFSPRQIADLLALPGVVGIKESILDLGEVKKHMALCRGMKKAFFGSTALYLTQFMKLGGHGFMCPEAVLLPCPTVQAYEAYVHGRYAEARAIQKELFELTPVLRYRMKSSTMSQVTFMALEDVKFPVPMSQDQTQAKVKAALNGFGVPTPTYVKCPLQPLTARDRRSVDNALATVNQIDWGEFAEHTPPVSLAASPSPVVGGALLKTGAFQLGRGVGKDLLRSQWDGKSGFLFD